MLLRWSEWEERNDNGGKQAEIRSELRVERGREESREEHPPYIYAHLTGTNKGKKKWEMPVENSLQMSRAAVFLYYHRKDAIALSSLLLLTSETEEEPTLPLNHSSLASTY
jgi:hypothetical protein